MLSCFGVDGSEQRTQRARKEQEVLLYAGSLSLAKFNGSTLNLGH